VKIGFVLTIISVSVVSLISCDSTTAVNSHATDSSAIVGVWKGVDPGYSGNFENPIADIYLCFEKTNKYNTFYVQNGSTDSSLITYLRWTAGSWSKNNDTIFVTETGWADSSNSRGIGTDWKNKQGIQVKNSSDFLVRKMVNDTAILSLHGSQFKWINKSIVPQSIFADCET
jgi:hypothetical protein